MVLSEPVPYFRPLEDAPKGGRGLWGVPLGQRVNRSGAQFRLRYAPMRPSMKIWRPWRSPDSFGVRRLVPVLWARVQIPWLQQILRIHPTRHGYPPPSSRPTPRFFVAGGFGNRNRRRSERDRSHATLGDGPACGLGWFGHPHPRRCGAGRSLASCYRALGRRSRCRYRSTCAGAPFRRTAPATSGLRRRGGHGGGIRGSPRRGSFRP